MNILLALLLFLSAIQAHAAAAGAPVAQTEPNPLAEARDLVKAAKFAEAARAYRKIAEVNPGSYDATFELAQVLLQLDEWKAAEEFAAKAEKLQPTLPAPAALRGRALYRAGNPREAGFRFLRALSLNQKMAGALTGLASLRWQRRETDGSLTYLREAISVDPLAPEGWYWLGKVFEDQNQLALAADAFKRYVSFKVAGYPGEARSAALRELIPFYESFGSATAMQTNGPRSAAVELELRRGAPVIRANLANGQHLNLLLDTAAKFPLTLNAATAKRFNLPASFDGSCDFVLRRAPCRLGKLAQLRIGEMEIRNVPLAVADLTPFRDEISPDIPDIDGMLGVAFFHDFEITIDYKQRIVTLGLPELASMIESVDRPQASGAPPKFSITVPLHSIDHRLVFFAEIEDKNAAMLLNTSALESFVSAKLASSRSGKARDTNFPTQPDDPFQFDLAGGVFPLSGIRSTEDLDVVASRDLSFQISVALGNSFLSRLQRLTINLATMSVRLDIETPAGTR